MYPIPGHLAFAASTARLFGVSVTAAAVGTIAPDIIDKGLNDFLHITPYGRYFMHSVMAAVLCSIGAGLIKGRSWGWGWFAGHFSHIVGDLGSFIPLWMPFVRYDWPVDINVTLYAVLNPLRHLFSPEMGAEILMIFPAVGLFHFAESTDRDSRFHQYGCYVGIWVFAGLRIWLAARN